MKDTRAKQPGQSPIKAKDQTANRKAKPPAPPADPRGAKYVNPGQEPISHPLNKPMTFRDGVYGKGE